MHARLVVSLASFLVGCASFDGEAVPADAGVEASPSDAGGTAAGTTARYMFVSSETYKGDTRGLVGADAKCAALVSGNPKLASRSFKAWLSTGSTDARDRFAPHPSRPIVRPDDTRIAADLAALLAGPLEAPVNITNAGVRLDAPAEVWTGTAPSGRFSRGACSAWNQSVPTESGGIGDPASTTSAWTDRGIASCDGARFLYCLED